MSLNNLKLNSFEKAKSCQKCGENPQQSAAAEHPQNHPKSHPQSPNPYEEKGKTGSKYMRSPFLWGCEWCEILWRSQRLLGWKCWEILAQVMFPGHQGEPNAAS